MEYRSTPTFLLMKGAVYVPRLILNKNVGTPRLKARGLPRSCAYVFSLFVSFVHMPNYFEPRLKLQVMYAV